MISKKIKYTRFLELMLTAITLTVSLGIQEGSWLEDRSYSVYSIELESDNN